VVVFVALYHMKSDVLQVVLAGGLVGVVKTLLL
jgi:hypothetical protein